MENIQIIIAEKITSIKVNNAFNSINNKDINYQLAQDIYELLFELKSQNKTEYKKILSLLNIEDANDVIDFKEKFIEKLPNLVVPNDYEKTVLNTVNLIKSEETYYSANKSKTVSSNNILKECEAKEFLLMCQPSIKFEYIGAVLGFAISGNMNYEYNDIMNKKGEVKATELWKRLKYCNKRVYVDFNKIDSNIDAAIDFKEQSDDLRGANIIDGWFVNMGTNTIYPLFCSSNEDTSTQNEQYYKKMTLLKKWGEKNGSKISPIYLINSYFNEKFDGDKENKNVRQHSTDFLNSFNPKLTNEQKNKLNNTVFLSLFGNVVTPNDIHKDINIMDLISCNPFAVGSNTLGIAKTFMTASNLESPVKEQYIYNYLLNEIHQVTDILKKSVGLDASNETVSNILNNLNRMLQGLDNFNLSNMPEKKCYHLSEDNIIKLTEISKNINEISSKTVNFTTTELFKSKKAYKFKSENTIRNYYQEFYDVTSEFYNYETKTHIQKNQLDNESKAHNLRNQIINDSSLMNKIHDLVIGLSNEDENIIKFGIDKFKGMVVESIVIKMIYPETPFASAKNVSGTLYQNLKYWSGSETNSAKLKIDFFQNIFKEANKFDNHIDLINHLCYEKNQKKNKIN